MAAGAPHFPVSDLFGVTVMSSRYDLTLLVLIGFVVSLSRCCSEWRQLVDAQNTGKALWHSIWLFFSAPR